ncbi:MAG: type 4a pilus biogenesis protein PilO [Acidobacteriota bacterium]
MAAPETTRKTNGFDIRRESGTIIVILLAAFVLNILFFIFFTRLAISGYRSLNADSNPTMQALDKKKAMVLELEQRLARIEETERSIKQFYEKILSTKDQKMIDIQLEIVSIANEFGINPESVSYDNEEMPKEGVERFSISLPMTGTYGNLRQFINKIENSTNFMIIDRVFLRTAKEGGVILQLNIQLSTFFNAPYLSEMRNEMRKMRRRI